MIFVTGRRFWLIFVLALLFVLWPGRQAAGITTVPQDAQARLLAGFRQILSFFEARDFSLLEAWRLMRASGDPDFFEHQYPEISGELDAWAATLENRFGISEAAEEGRDFTFLLEELAPAALDPASRSVVRDNAVATICMICVMDSLRCDEAALHRFLATVVSEDPSIPRKAEALRWWRRSDGFIDEGLLERTLSSPAGQDLDLRSEIARTLFTIGTRRSLRAQRLLASTRGLAEDPTGAQQQIACTAIRHFARARFEEAAPDLIGALDDPAREVRACAAESLARLSGREFGFDASLDPEAPANASARTGWSAWYRSRTPATAGFG
ncbi:MAG TPA: hypothetical protein VFP98_06415, partial [Candidatus Polarisedimenticolia bacterium]|nr:hypothetical protein [Candidatus Polarisedimenticolia bacterium]